MEGTGSACSLLLLTMAALSSGRNATEYFQQARFQHTPSRPEDAIVFFTATAPPLICEPEKDGEWNGGDRLKADLILKFSEGSSYYMCSFEGNATATTNLKLIQNSLPNVFTLLDERKILFSKSGIDCSRGSQLPDEYFQLKIHHPFEERPVKCHIRTEGEKLYVRFPGYPTIICKSFGYFYGYSFFLPGIVGNHVRCAFQVYVDTRMRDEQTEEWLHQSLVSGFPTRVGGGFPDVVCSPHGSSYATAHFQVRLPGGTTYDCRFSHT